jgi:2-hydroxychromene-2-carboxylate isomerase
MADPRPIDFYFEFASPYGYLASLEIDGLAEKYGREVNWRPFMLGAAFKITNSAPNMTIPMKGAYLYRDVERCAKLMGVPLTNPEASPMNSLAAMRAFYWLLDTDPAKAVALAKAVYQGHWGEGRDLSPVEAVADTAGRIGVDGAALVAATQDPAVKDRLKRETQQAIDRGAFGSPFFFVDDEAYWGHDRLSHIERQLQHGGI